MAGEFIVKHGLIVSGSLLSIGGITGSFTGSFAGTINNAATASVAGALIGGEITVTPNLSSNLFLITSASAEVFKITDEKVTVFSIQPTLPSGVVVGGLVVSSSGELFIGSNQ